MAAYVTQADVEATAGRKLSWWERIGFWWQNTTEGGGLEEDRGRWSEGTAPIIGDASEAVAATTWGQAAAAATKATVDGTEAGHDYLAANWVKLAIYAGLALLAVGAIYTAFIGVAGGIALKIKGLF